MSSSAWLALLLDGPIQSWGVSSRFTRRTTAPYPTKSAVIGIVAAALGVNKHGENEREQIKPLSGLSLTTVTLPRYRNGRELPMLQLSDFHTVGGGYKESESMKKPKAANGLTLHSVLSERHYLLDARFGVLLEGDKDYLHLLANKLTNPTWGLWLGRKCCIPSSPILVGLGHTKTEAWKLILKAAQMNETAALESFDHVTELQSHQSSDGEWLNDSPQTFGAPLGTRHEPRCVRRVQGKR